MQASSHNEDAIFEPATVVTCRCEDVLTEEIVAALAAAARTVDDVKRRTRAGMGLCQGIFCIPVIAALVAQATEMPLERVAAMTARPPVRPVPLETLAELDQTATVPDDPAGNANDEVRA